jgi:hypothetical protein
MSVTVTDLITQAYYASGIVSRDFQTVSGTQMNDGLKFLNDLLGEKTLQKDQIPYYVTQFQFPAIIGQEKYFIPNLIQVETLSFFLDNVRYSMFENSEDIYFGTPRANNILSLPFNWAQQRVFGGLNIYLYFFPDRAYTMELSGTFRLAFVTLNQDLSLTLDRFYTSYLKYELAERLCSEFNYSVPPGVDKQLLIFRQALSKRSAIMDLHIHLLSTLNPNEAINYGQVNIGHGWTTS